MVIERTVWMVVGSVVAMRSTALQKAHLTAPGWQKRMLGTESRDTNTPSHYRQETLFDEHFKVFTICVWM